MADPIIVSVITTLAANVIVITAGKKWIDFKFEKELEKHRAQLNRENEMDISKYKEELRKDTEKELTRLNAELQTLTAEHAAKLSHDNELALAAFKHSLEQHNFRFSQNFKECAEAIKHIYGSVVELRDHVNRYLMHIESPDRILKAAFLKQLNAKWNTFEAYFERNKILIPPKVAELARHFCQKLGEYKRKYASLVAFENSDRTGDKEDIWQRRSTEVNEIMFELPTILKSLADECQKELGFTDKANN